MTGQGDFCPVGCGRITRQGMLMCAQCWSLVPRPLQRAVYRHWAAVEAAKPLDAATMRPYRAARHAAIRAAKTHISKGIVTTP